MPASAGAAHTFSASRALGTIRQIGLKEKISEKQLEWYCRSLFPPSHRSFTFSKTPTSSPGWKEALRLVQIARDNSGGTRDTERRVVQYILNHGRFPYTQCGWSVSLGLLQRWRCLTSERFPKTLTPDSAAHIALQLSFCEDASLVGVSPWEDSLRLYKHTVENSLDPTQTSHRSSLSRLRHTVLTTLLRQNEWQRALHFYKHTLFQKEVPDHVITGFLVQRLGDVGQWESVLEIFNICVKLVASNFGKSGEEKMRLCKNWGTSLSMCMEAAARHNPNLVAPLVEAVRRAALDQDGTATGHIKLDGNFLAAVQHIPSEVHRREVLTLAKKANLLDYYKLIRGLSSQKKVEDALQVYADAIRHKPALLSRKEVGLSRLNILNATSQQSVGRVVSQLHELGGRATSPLLLNDAEVECVLAKSIYTTDNYASSFWVYCLKLFEANYPHAFSSPKPLKRCSHNRVPSVSSLSLFLRNSQMPWWVALHVVSCLDASSTICPSSSPSSLRKHQVDDNKSPSPEVLLLSAAAHILYNQGHHTEADRVAARAIREYGSSPSAAFLQCCSYECLVETVLQPEVHIDTRVVHHLLTDTEGDAELRPLVVLSVWMKKLCGIDWQINSHVSHLMRCHHDMTETPKKATHPCAWLSAVPASIHCAVFMYLRRVAAAALAKPSSSELSSSSRCYELTLSYLQFLSPKDGSMENSCTTRRDLLLRDYYCATYEAIITILSFPSTPALASSARHGSRSLPVPTTSSHKVKLMQNLLEACTVRYGYLPPSHMFLPNQMERLLPMLEKAKIKHKQESANSSTLLLEQYEVAKAFVKCCWHILNTSPALRDTGSVEPVAFHSLLKLCCRIREYESWLQQLSSTSRASPPSTVPLCEFGGQLLQRQSTQCGLHTVKPASLRLLYALCEGDGWEVALRTTQRLIEQEAAERSSGRRATTQPHAAATATSVVQPTHYRQFSTLFGWQRGLQLWYGHLPSDVLLGVARHKEAVTYCLHLGEE